MRAGRYLAWCTCRCRIPRIPASRVSVPGARPMSRAPLAHQCAAHRAPDAARAGQPLACITAPRRRRWQRLGPHELITRRQFHQAVPGRRWVGRSVSAARSHLGMGHRRRTGHRGSRRWPGGGTGKRSAAALQHAADAAESGVPGLRGSGLLAALAADLRAPWRYCATRADVDTQAQRRQLLRRQRGEPGVHASPAAPGLQRPADVHRAAGAA